MKGTTLLISLLYFSLSCASAVEAQQRVSLHQQNAKSHAVTQLQELPEQSSTSSAPSPSIEETVQYINKHLSWREWYSGVQASDSISLSSDRRKIIITTVLYDRSTGQYRNTRWVNEVYAESLDASGVTFDFLSDCMRVFITCKNDISCSTTRMYTPELFSTNTGKNLVVFSAPDTQVGERLVNAFKHFVLSLQAEIKQKGTDPNDPFAPHNPIK